MSIKNKGETVLYRTEIILSTEGEAPTSLEASRLIFAALLKVPGVTVVSVTIDETTGELD